MRAGYPDRSEGKTVGELLMTLQRKVSGPEPQEAIDVAISESPENEIWTTGRQQDKDLTPPLRQIPQL